MKTSPKCCYNQNMLLSHSKTSFNKEKLLKRYKEIKGRPANDNRIVNIYCEGKTVEHPVFSRFSFSNLTRNLARSPRPLTGTTGIRAPALCEQVWAFSRPFLSLIKLNGHFTGTNKTGTFSVRLLCHGL